MCSQAFQEGTQTSVPGLFTPALAQGPRVPVTALGAGVHAAKQTEESPPASVCVLV